MYTALLDPVALNRVSDKHLGEMKGIQRDLLQDQEAIVLAEEEVWEMEEEEGGEEGGPPPGVSVGSGGKNPVLSFAAEGVTR